MPAVSVKYHEQIRLAGETHGGSLKAPSLLHRTVQYQSGVEKRALSPDDGAEPSSKKLLEMSKAQKTKRNPGY